MSTKILVVDDEPDLEPLMRQRFRRLIRAGEYEFLFARDGLEALEVLRGDPEIPVVLTDINMPRMDGLTLLCELERLGCLAKAVVISAYGDMENIRTAMNRGAFDFLMKPIDFEDVEITIQKTIHVVSQLRESRRAEEYRIAKETAEHNYQQLRELEELRDLLTHMLVHDLRTPLTSFLTGLQTLEALGGLDPTQQEMLDLAVDGGESLLGMINDLLDISKAEDGSLTLDLEPACPAEIARVCLPAVAYLVHAKELTVSLEVSGDAPSTIRADVDKLRRTLVNLLGNSVKFTPERGSVVLTVHLDAESGGARFSVADTGMGIPPESFERIFEKFGQVGVQRSSRERSTGLGLTFCKMVVEAHGGRIWVESELGQGSTFHVVIPASQTAPQGAAE